MENYDATLRQQEQDHIFEKVATLKSNNITHYIPHQVVITLHKDTTKLRIVYDASAKSNKSL